MDTLDFRKKKQLQRLQILLSVYRGFSIWHNAVSEQLSHGSESTASRFLLNYKSGGPFLYSKN
jgi:hypothetical protein